MPLTKRATSSGGILVALLRRNHNNESRFQGFLHSFTG